jgi:hypothetical protein
MNENYGRKCSGFCFDQMEACLKIAQLARFIRQKARERLASVA